VAAGGGRTLQVAVFVQCPSCDAGRVTLPLVVWEGLLRASDATEKPEGAQEA
jgi:hypothetical protein